MDLFLPKVCKNSYEFYGKPWSPYGGYVNFLSGLIADPVQDLNKIYSNSFFQKTTKTKIYL
jgi:hypothetical protein